LLAEYEVYLAFGGLNAAHTDSHTFSDDDLEEFGIIVKNLLKAGEVIERLHRDLKLSDVELTVPTAEDETHLMRSIVSGQINQLWYMNEEGKVEHIFTGQVRELSSNTVVRNPQLVAGTPFDLQIPTHSGLEVLNLLTAVTAVDTNWLLELPSEEFRAGRSRILYDPRINSLARRQQIRFGKRTIEGESQPILEDTPENRSTFIREYARWCFDQLERQRRNFERFYKNVPIVSLKQVEHEVKVSAGGIVSLDQLSSKDKREMIALSKLETYLGDDFAARLARSGGGHRSNGAPKRDEHRPRRHGWKPQHKRKFRRDNWG
jgi:hypothetical protein